MFETRIRPDINQGGFGTLEDIMKSGVQIDYKEGSAKVAGVSMISDGRKATIFDDDGFYLVCGGTSSKKTRNVVAPYIYNNALAGDSMIISDIKGDLYKLLYSRLKELGYRIIVLDFNEPEKGDAYNPIQSIYRDYKAGRVDKANRELNNISEMIFGSVKSEKEPFWHNTASLYFLGCELTLFDLFDEKCATIDNALNLHIQGEKKLGSTTYMKDYYSDMEHSEAWKLLMGTVNAPSETKASIHSVYTTALNKLIGQNKALVEMMSHSTFDIKDLVEEKTAIFIISNEETLSVHGGLITILTQQWYDMLISLADQTNGSLKRNISFVLDEFGNLPAIKDFQTKISLSRARGISWMIVVQSFAQLTLKYGQDVARTIIGNTSNWVYLFSPDPELLNYISNLCGDVIDEYTGQTRKLLSVSQLRHFEKRNEEGLTECLMILGRMKPFISYLPDISQYYGIAPLDSLNIAVREKKEIEELNFTGAVEHKRRQKMQRMVEESEQEKKAAYEEVARKREEAMKTAPNSLTCIMNSVIADLVGGKIG